MPNEIRTKREIIDDQKARVTEEVITLDIHLDFLTKENEKMPSKTTEEKKLKAENLLQSTAQVSNNLTTKKSYLEYLNELKG